MRTTSRQQQKALCQTTRRNERNKTQKFSQESNTQAFVTKSTVDGLTDRHTDGRTNNLTSHIARVVYR